jgi:hypothetical protein
VVGEAVYCEDAATAGLTCCDLFGNDGGDWVGHIAPQCGVGGNINENPLFCRDENPDEPYSLHDGSPCALVTNPTCGLIGAWDVGCAATAVRPATWGEIKASFR